MPRPSWKGYLKLSLVSCPVALYPGTTSRERVSFNILNRNTGHRTRYLVVDSETEEPVEPEDRVRGYQIAKNQYVQLEDDEIESVKLESTHTIDIEYFVPRAEVDEIYLNAPYYIAPDEDIGQDAFAVIREAMRSSKMVGIARIVMARRERLLMVEPRGKGLMAMTLRNANEVYGEAAYFDDIKDIEISHEMLSIASDIISRKTAKFDPKKFQDRYEQALVALIEAKRAGMPAPTAEAPQPRPTVNLMDALRRSLEREPSEAQPQRRGRRAAGAARSATARRRHNGKAAARRAS